MWPPSRSKYLYIVISRSSMIEVMRTLNISLCTVIEVLHFRQAQIYLFLIVFVFIKGNAVVCWRAGLDSVQPTSRWPPYQVSLLVKYWLKDLRVNCKVTKSGDQINNFKDSFIFATSNSFCFYCEARKHFSSFDSIWGVQKWWEEQRGACAY